MEQFTNRIFNNLSLGNLIPWFLLALSIVIIYGCTHNSQAQNQFQLGLPIKCSAEDNCFILLYSDRDPSNQAQDFQCGFQTYDGHKGTDFAISDTQVMNKGIPVIASADGIVLRVRDGVPDRRLSSPQTPPEIEGKECGNGVVIDHGDGWQTQYCHLRQNSIQVTSGQNVKQGESLGFVGMSGLASFPHVHLQVTHNSKVVDPFVGLTESTGCQTKLNPIWDQKLTYQPTGLVRAGFATEPPKTGQLWEGKFTDFTIEGEPSVLIFWSHAYGVMADDEEYLELIDPQGKVVAKTQKKN